MLALARRKIIGFKMKSTIANNRILTIGVFTNNISFRNFAIHLPGRQKHERFSVDMSMAHFFKAKSIPAIPVINVGLSLRPQSNCTRPAVWTKNTIF
jgi:hypothetical protein